MPQRGSAFIDPALDRLDLLVIQRAVGVRRRPALFFAGTVAGEAVIGVVLALITR